MPRRRRSRRTSKRRSSSASIFPRRRSRSKTPAWHWLLTGMLLGGLAILFLHMNASQGISGWSNANPSAASQEKYEFYQLLTKSDDIPAAEVVKQAQSALPVAVKKELSADANNLSTSCAGDALGKASDNSAMAPDT